MSEKIRNNIHEEKSGLPAHTETIEELPTYSIKQEGGFSHIVNAKGEKVSDSYHELKQFKVGDASAWIGKLGAMERLLKPPHTEDGLFEESGAKFHLLKYDKKLRLLLATTGALSYVVDPRSAQEISGGYHDFFWRDGKLYGRTGSTEEEVVLEGDLQLASGPHRLEDKRSE